MNRQFQLPVIYIEMLRIHDGKKYQEEERGGEYIKPDGIEIGSPAALHVFSRKKTWFAQEQTEGAEEFPVEMGDIVKKMGDQAPYRVARFAVFLAANMAIKAL
jgi:hypothetical protein